MMQNRNCTKLLAAQDIEKDMAGQIKERASNTSTLQTKYRIPLKNNKIQDYDKGNGVMCKDIQGGHKKQQIQI